MKAIGKCYIPDAYSPIVQVGQSTAHQQRSASLDNHLLVTNIKKSESYKEQYIMADYVSVYTLVYIYT